MAGDAINATLTDLPADRYTVLQQLGKNAGRQTLLAQDHQTNQTVVIKLLTFDQEFEWEDLKLFEREAETLKALSHPNIPQYRDFFEIETANAKRLALVQSYVAGRSLADYLESGQRFTPPEIREIGRALLHILVYLHGRQPPVIHRDIKPSNIILGDRSGNSIGQVYLVDFGSVQTLATQAGQTFTVVGTYGYMPPEQFSGRSVAASDLYGVGATLIALATGKHPAELPQANLHIQFEAFASLPPALTDWLHRLTEPDLTRRFTSAPEALSGLDQLQCWYERSRFLPQQLSTPTLLFSTTGQGTITGFFSGIVFGGAFGTSLFPVIGTISGAAIGGMVGLGIGIVNGLVLGVVTRLFFYPLPHDRNPRSYRRMMQITSFVVITAGSFIALYFCLYPHLTLKFLMRDPTSAFLTLPLCLIAGLAGSLQGRAVVRWYERQCFKQEK